MTIDRRGFLYAGGLGAATAPFVMTAHAAPAGAPGVADFGVQPNAASDQTAALQNALTELTRAGQPVVLPAGVYSTGPLTLPKGCTIVGTPGLTTLRAKSAGPLLSGDKLGVLHISGVTFEGAANKSGAALLSAADATVTIAWCRFSGSAASAAQLDKCSGTVQSVAIAGTIGTGISAAQASGLTITACRIAACESAGIAVSGAGEDAAGFTISQNHIASCATGVAADGIGVVTGNVVTAATRFGLRLGRADGQGQVLAQGNILRGCRIGIGVAASGDDIMASLNFIAGARDGGIRVLDGERLVGPDLVRQSAESYLNLMVAGNVAR